jgi:hypothetical protein
MSPDPDKHANQRHAQVTHFDPYTAHKAAKAAADEKRVIALIPSIVPVFAEYLVKEAYINCRAGRMPTATSAIPREIRKYISGAQFKALIKAYLKSKGYPTNDVLVNLRGSRLGRTSHIEITNYLGKPKLPDTPAS